MILPDTSAWIEYLRGSGQPSHLSLQEAVTAGQDIGTIDVVMMELLAGAPNDERYQRISRLLARFEFVGTRTPWDYVAAADLYRRCRAAGVTIRKMNDCLIATVAIRTGAELLHQDRDFEAIAQHSALKIYVA